MFTILLHVWELYKHLATGSFFVLEISHAFILFISTHLTGRGIESVILITHVSWEGSCTVTCSAVLPSRRARWMNVTDTYSGLSMAAFM